MTTITKFTTDSGIVGDGITNDSALLLSGTATANSTVKVYDGSTLLGSTTANSSGAWSYTTGTLSDGAHSFTAATSSSGTGTSTTGFPDASTTGVRDGVTLKPSGDITISTAGAVVSGLDITGNVVITAPNVTLVDCKITGNLSLASTGAVVDHCTVIGKNTTDSIDINPNGVDGQGASTTIKNCDISGSENGIWLEANGAVIENNYIHNLFSNNGNPDPHIDGIQVPGANIGATQSKGATITGNNIDLDNSTANSCLALRDVADFNISNNRFSGGSYVVYFDATQSGSSTGNHLVNNVFAQYTYGYVAGQAETAQTYSGNVTDKGVPLVQSNSVQDLVPSSGAASATTASSATTDTSAALSVTIDTKAPDAPTIASDVVNSANQVVLSGKAEANSAIKVYDGTTQVGTATTNSSGVWSVTTSALLAGAHTLTAKATDAAGNVSAASSAVDPVIGSGSSGSGSSGSGTSGSGTSGSGTSGSGTSGSSSGTTAPGAPKIASFSTDTGVVGDNITKDNTLELKGTAAAGSTVKIYDGKTQIGSTIADSKGSWDYITKVLTDATHTLTATATNSSGKTSAASSALAVTVDTQTPTPTITGNTVNSAHQVVVTGTAEANSTVKVYDGTTSVGTATTNSSGVWSLTTSALSTGSHVLTAKATDVAGNVSAASAAVNPVIGGSSGSGSGSGSGSNLPAAPKISSFSKDTGAVGDHITSDNTVTLTGTAVAKSTVNVYDGQTQIGHVTADAKGAWSYTTAVLPEGKHTFTATDTVSSATSGKSAALALTVDTSAPDAPVLLSDAISHHRATVTGTAEAGSTVKVYEGTTLLGSGTTGADGHFSVTTSGLQTGSHTFVASATDVAGNTSAMSQPIDPPIGSHGTSTVDVTNIRSHWDHTATIKGTADPNSQIKLFDGTASAGSVTAGADGKWSFHTADLSGKTHAFTAEQVDTTGHTVGTSSGEAIIGTGRSNTLTGTTGNDVMVGKGGADTFVFASNFGSDVIKDFAASGPAHDTVQFSKGVFDSFASVLSHAAQSGNDVVVTAGSDTLTLKNTQLDKLTSHDFHFA
ncbi:Ig-like domain-containing protein [Bradyrhizobium sp. UFLA05-112]